MTNIVADSDGDWKSTISHQCGCLTGGTSRPNMLMCFETWSVSVGPIIPMLLVTLLNQTTENYRIY